MQKCLNHEHENLPRHLLGWESALVRFFIPACLLCHIPCQAQTQPLPRPKCHNTSKVLFRTQHNNTQQHSTQHTKTMFQGKAHNQRSSQENFTPGLSRQHSIVSESSADSLGPLLKRPSFELDASGSQGSILSLIEEEAEPTRASSTAAAGEGLVVSRTTSPVPKRDSLEPRTTHSYKLLLLSDEDDGEEEEEEEEE